MIVPDLLRAQLRTDAARPFVTFYDDRTGERVELSVATFDNWVAKTANLLQDGLAIEPGGRVSLLLPLHWQSAVWLLAAWSCGLVAATGGEPGAPDLAVCGPAELDQARRTGADVLALSLRPLGGRFADPLPPGVLDYAVEVPGYGDRFVAHQPVDPDSPAFEVAGESWTQAELVSAAQAHGAEPGERLLTTQPYGVATGVIRGLVSPLAANGSIVQCRNLDPALLPGRIQTERVTTTLL